MNTARILFIRLCWQSTKSCQKKLADSAIVLEEYDNAASSRNQTDGTAKVKAAKNSFFEKLLRSPALWSAVPWWFKNK
jgi:hypothetical protein